jgi:hypothetical protein
MNLNEKILKIAIEQFPDVTEKDKISRYYPNSTQREAGAFLWGIGERNIGSCFTMRECVKAKSWHIISRVNFREIVPQN